MQVLVVEPLPETTMVLTIVANHWGVAGLSPHFGNETWRSLTRPRTEGTPVLTHTQLSFKVLPMSFSKESGPQAASTPFHPERFSLL